MIKLNLVAVGKLKESYFREAFSEYRKRLHAFCDFELYEIPECPEAGTVLAVKAAEGRRILERTDKNGGALIALDKDGEMLKSQEFSELIRRCIDKRGVLNFAVGGSDGLSSEVLSRADKTVSFGKITFPHMLFRVVIAEQIYRAFMIMSNREYHK